MNITKEEKMMYEVIKAIYKSGIPISFKGSMVLKVCLLEAGFIDDTRHTVDIDANWNSDYAPTTEQIAQSLQMAIDKFNIDLYVKVYRQYGDKRSAGFELTTKDTDEVLFTMDIDVNRPMPLTKIYEVEDLRFKGSAPNQIIADKVAVVSSEKVFRRIKDVIDLYYLSKVFDFNKEEIKDILEKNGRELGNFEGFITQKDDLKNSYEKFRFDGEINKPMFNEVYETVKKYIEDIIYK